MLINDLHRRTSCSYHRSLYQSMCHLGYSHTTDNLFYEFCQCYLLSNTFRLSY